jgi:RND family efflux transporter MFP subunit
MDKLPWRQAAGLFPRGRWPFAAAAAVLMLAGGCNRPAGEAAAPDPPQARQTQAAAAPRVAVVRPRRKTVRHPVEQPGFNIEAFRVAPLFPRISGYIGKWDPAFDIGKHVYKEQKQALAELYVPERLVDLRQKEAVVKQAEAQVLQAKASKLSAEALLARLKSQYERLSQRTVGTLDEETIAESKLGYDAARAGLAKAGADVQAAEAQLEVARANRDYSRTMLDYAQVRAPFDGVITARNINEGDFVQPAGVFKAGAEPGAKGLPLFVVSQMDPVRVFVNVPGADARWIKDGDPVTLRLQGAGGEVIEGKVTRNARSLDPAARTLRTEIDLANPRGKLLPGMYVQARIVVEHRGVWTLPASAVMTEGDQTFCYRVAGGKALRTPLQVGLRGGGRVEVLKKQMTAPSPGEEGRWESITGDEEIAADAAPLHSGQSVQTLAAEK